MAREGLKLTTYIGERDRVGRRLLADALMDLYDRHGVGTSVLFRGIEGFGMKHTLHTDRLLTLSEDLPLLAVAVDEAQRIEALAPRVRDITRHGLITLERALLLGEERDAAELPQGPEQVKLTIYLGRQERVGGRPAYLAVVEHLHRHGVAGASVLLGVDGIAHGVRRRGRFLAGNAEVPLMIVSVGERDSIVTALAQLRELLCRPVITLERVRVCKRDGERLADPLTHVPALDGSGLSYWQKLTVFAGGRCVHEGRQLHAALIRRLRLEGATGATALRGQWGYHGRHAPHGERFFSLRPHVPVLTVLLDTPENMRRSFETVDELTEVSGLVTSELVPALRAGAPDAEHGRLVLAPPT